MKRNWLLYALLFSLSLNLGVIGAWGYFHWAKTPPPPPPPPSGVWLPPGLGRLLHNLDLDQEQRAGLQRYFQEQHQSLRERRQQLAKARAELLELLQAEPPDEAAIVAKVQEITTYQGQLESQLTSALLATFRILRPEQKRQLVNNLNRRFCRPEGRGPHGGPPGWLKEP